MANPYESPKSKLERARSDELPDDLKHPVAEFVIMIFIIALVLIALLAAMLPAVATAKRPDSDQYTARFVR